MRGVENQLSLIRAVKKHLHGGKSFGEIACSLKIPNPTVYTVWKKIRIHGLIENKVDAEN